MISSLKKLFHLHKWKHVESKWVLDEVPGHGLIRYHLQCECGQHRTRDICHFRLKDPPL